MRQFEQEQISIDPDTYGEVVPSVHDWERGVSMPVYDAVPVPLNHNDMMLTSAATAEQITAPTYNVEAYALDNSELGLEALPSQLIDEPLTTSKKWLIVGVIVVLGIIGYFIYKQSKNDKKKY